MHIKELCGKKICILGFGREGQATVRTLEKYAPGSSIVIADRNEELRIKNKELRIKNYEYQYGEHYLNNLDRFDVVIKSPGIPPSELLTTHYSLLTTPTQIFFDSIADSGATVIGVTGSKGKSTTASLLYDILNSQFLILNSKTAFLIGNIGEPALNYLDQANEKAVFIMELSSYQLADLTVSPQIAVITSFFPEHLDYHASLEAYKEAKRNICRFQKESDVVFYAAQSPPPHPALSPSRGERVERVDGEGTFTIATASPGKRIPYSEEDAPVTLEETHLLGTHNLRNIAGAWKVTEYLGVPRDVAIDAIKAFRPLPHRLQSLGIHHGIEWVDDAISTTPESTIAALDALGDRVATIILGGQDRGNDFTELARRLKNSSVKLIILFPGSGPRIRQALEATEVKARLLDVESMREAVLHAKNHSQFLILNSQFPIVLLSTASPSYGMFKNFEEKGECFQKAIVP